jgi:hypothetical protein
MPGLPGFDPHPQTKTGYFLKTAYPIKAHEVADWVKRYREAKETGHV